MKLPVDLSALPVDVCQAFEYLNRENVARRIFDAKRRQEQLARAQRARKRRSIDGLGPQTLAIDPMIQDLLNDEYGPDARTPEFRAWLRKKWDAVRVESGGTKVQVGYGSGIIAAPRPSYLRTVKRYAS